MSPAMPPATEPVTTSGSAIYFDGTSSARHDVVVEAEPSDCGS